MKKPKVNKNMAKLNAWFANIPKVYLTGHSLDLRRRAKERRERRNAKRLRDHNRSIKGNYYA